MTEIEAGEVLAGRYEIIEVLEQSAGESLCRARDRARAEERLVRISPLPVDTAVGKLACALRHPNICRVHHIERGRATLGRSHG